jgi:hypothetical protein
LLRSHSRVLLWRTIRGLESRTSIARADRSPRSNAGSNSTSPSFARRKTHIATRDHSHQVSLSHQISHRHQVTAE